MYEELIQLMLNDIATGFKQFGEMAEGIFAGASNGFSVR